MEINNLVDLSRYRSAPELNNFQINKLSYELQQYISNSDWITVGIMASHDFEAVKALKSISQKYPSIRFNDLDTLQANGRVFLKANQKTGNVFIRTENGLGEGILLTCQYEEDSEESTTFGPLPLNFFTN